MFENKICNNKNVEKNFFIYWLTIGNIVKRSYYATVSPLVKYDNVFFFWIISGLAQGKKDLDNLLHKF